MTTPTAATPEELAARIEVVGTEAAQTEIRQDIAAAIRQHSAPLEAQIAELTRILAARDEQLTAEIGMSGKFATDLVAARAAMTAERDAAYQRGYDARQAEIVRALEEAGGRIVLTHGPASVGMVTLTNERAEAAEARATQAEASLAAMNPANPDWREVAMSNGKALGERNAAWDRLNAELAASQERERVMREALTGLADVLERDCGVEPCASSMAPAERYLGMARNLLAATQPKEPAHDR